MYLFIFVDNSLANPPSFYKQHMIYMWSYIKDIMAATLLAPENGWLEDDPFLLGG